MVLKLLGGLQLHLAHQAEHVRTVIRNFFPVFISRGVVQISAYVDTMIASFLPGGAVAALASAQVLYTLPVSLFGMAVSAAELPAMSSVAGGADEVAAALRIRLERGLRRIAFFVLPSGVAFIALGDIVAGALFQTGRFTRADTLYVWGILAGSAVGLLASTLGRLYASAYYALRDTRTPLRFAVVRVTLTVALGLLFAFPLPRLLGLGPAWGAAGLTASAGIAGWVEFALLRRGLNARIGRTGLPLRFTLQLELAAVIGAAVAWGIKIASHEHQPIILAVITLLPYGAAYLAVAFAMGIGEARDLAARLRRRG